MANAAYIGTYCFIVCVLILLYFLENCKVPRMPLSYEPFNTKHRNYSFFSKHHYGDNILNLKFFYVAAPLLKKNLIHIDYYYESSYIKNVDELERYVDTSVVTLHPITELPEDAVELWMGNSITKGGKVYTYTPEFDVFYKVFYENIASIIRIPITSMNISLYLHESYLPLIYRNLDATFKDLDVLVINAKPQSDQFAYDESKMNALCMHLKGKNLKIATTGFVDESIPCTMSSGLKMQDIGAISTRSKYIVCSLTGPSTACFNTYTKEYVKNWFIFQDYPVILTELNNVHYMSSNDFEKIYSFF